MRVRRGLKINQKFKTCIYKSLNLQFIDFWFIRNDKLNKLLRKTVHLK